eukprot:m.300587 g.300587  ORF g.300587 m.300587 type:complete len:785 (-) comp14499_c0_seq1:166-2520(-)
MAAHGSAASTNGTRGRVLLEWAFESDTKMLKCTVVRAHDLPALDMNRRSDPYFVAEMRGPAGQQYARFKSPTIFSTLSPTYNAGLSFDLYPALMAANEDWRLHIEFWDYDRFKKDEFIGAMAFALDELTSKDALASGWYYLLPLPAGAKKNLPAVQVMPERAAMQQSRLSLWREEVGDDIYQALTKDQRYRMEGINELISTEKMFIDDLDFVLDMYQYSKFEQVLTQSEHHRMIGHLEEVRDVSMRLYLLLTSAEKREIAREFGALVQEMLPSMEPVYTSYCETNREVHDLITEKAADSHAFKAILEECKAESGNLDIFSFRLKPLQRITKYPLLLSEIDKHTEPDHSDKAATSQALADCASLVGRVNEHVREAELALELKLLSTHLVVPPALGPIELENGTSLLRSDVFVTSKSLKRKSSQFLKSSKALSDAKRRIAVLCNNALQCYSLLITQYGAERETLLFPQLPLESVAIQLSDLDDSGSEVMVVIPTLYTKEKNAKVLYLKPLSGGDAQSFVQELNELQSSYSAKLVTQSSVEEVVGYIGAIQAKASPSETEKKLLKAAQLCQGLMALAKQRETEFQNTIARHKKQAAELVDLVRSQEQEKAARQRDMLLAQQLETKQGLPPRVQWPDPSRLASRSRSAGTNSRRGASVAGLPPPATRVDLASAVRNGHSNGIANGSSGSMRKGNAHPAVPVLSPSSPGLTARFSAPAGLMHYDGLSVPQSAGRRRRESATDSYGEGLSVSDVSLASSVGSRERLDEPRHPQRVVRLESSGSGTMSSLV